MGAGKSTALQALARMGAAVLSSDAVVHELYEGHALRDAVIERWGPDLAPGGSLDRSLIAARVFSDEQERKWLEGLLWPMVGERIGTWLTEVRSRYPAPKAAVVETPLLFEAGMEGVYDWTIAVIAEESLRRERAAGRGHALIEERSSRQLSQEEKSRRADFTVHNDGKPSEMEDQLQSILEEIQRRTAR